jgi:hypothetical protein
VGAVLLARLTVLRLAQGLHLQCRAIQVETASFLTKVGVVVVVEQDKLEPMASTLEKAVTA